MGRLSTLAWRGWRTVSNADTVWSLLQIAGWSKAIGALAIALALAVTAYFDQQPWWIIGLIALGAFAIAIWAFNGFLFLFFGRKPLIVAGPENETSGTAQNAGDTFSATGTVSDPSPEAALERLLHTCYILAGAQKLKDGDFIDLTVVAYNASAKTITLAGVRGNARCTMVEGEKEITEKLGVPDLLRIAPERQIAPYSEFVMTLHQVVSARQSLLIRGTMRKKTVTLDLRDLRLEFEAYQEPGPRARLPLWDGVGMSETIGPRFARVMMMSASMSLGGGR